MNEYDTEKMYALLQETHQPVEDAQSAEVVIINTCSVREKAQNKLYGTLGHLQYLKQNRPNVVVGISGCVAQQEGQTIIDNSKAVDFVIGTHNLSLVPSLVKRAQQGGEELPKEFDSFDTNTVPLDTAFFSSTRALVAIQRGCEKHCSFCVVPTTRGPQVSRLADEVIREITLKARLGAKEVMLLGQTVNSYGLDLKPRFKFEKLIEAIADIPGIERIRFTSPHPAEVRPAFIDLYSRIPALCPHIHLPLQSGSDRILGLMNRNYRRKRYLEIVDSLKQKCPDIAITSDIIIGFPTETEEDFQDTMEIVKNVGYSSVFSFMYSVRPNTVAADEYTDEQLIEYTTAHRRLTELQKVQEDFSLHYNQQRMDSTVEVLIEGNSKKRPLAVRGRIPQNTTVEVVCDPEKAGGELPKAGQIVKAKITRASPHGLGAILIHESA
ncbi:UNVERIFIED_CONTAM: hypothetical protein GTU68_062482 [Idotea baltica]|nr:hypothetical protein [Idotea baltica]